MVLPFLILQSRPNSYYYLTVFKELYILIVEYKIISGTNKV